MNREKSSETGRLMTSTVGRGLVMFCRSLIVLLPLCFWQCKKDSPEGSSGSTQVYKIAFVNWDFTVGPAVTIADVCEENGAFALQNVRRIAEGSIPRISRDRSFLAYVYQNGQIYARLINSDGSGMRGVSLDTTGLMMVNEVVPSPDGRTLAVELQVNSEFRIGLVPQEGGHLKFIRQDGGWNFAPSWSPDGSLIYFSWYDFQNRFGNNDRGTRSYIAAIRSDGSNMQFVTDTLDKNAGDLFCDVSPDGSKLVMVSIRPQPAGLWAEIYTMNSNGSGLFRVTVAEIGAKHGDHYESSTMDDFPHWLKDGTHIVFQRNTTIFNDTTNDYEYLEDVFLVNSDGTGMQNLTKNKTSGMSKGSSRSSLIHRGMQGLLVGDVGSRNMSTP